MSDRYLIIKGVAGLGDRLLTIANAIDYAKKTERICIVDWSDGLFSAPKTDLFSNYFELKDVRHIHPEELDLNMQYSVYPKILKHELYGDIYDTHDKIVPTVISRFPISMAPKGEFMKIYGYWQHKKNKNRSVFANLFLTQSNIIQGRNLNHNRKEDIVFYADNGNQAHAHNLKKHIAIKGEMNTKIQDYVSKHELNKNCLGVHIRATDKILDNDINSIVNSIKSDFKTIDKIFLATDNSDIEVLFKKEFDNVLIFEKFLPKVEEGGIHHYAKLNQNWDNAELVLQESIMDMWLLANCEFLYYSIESSFSTIAKSFHEDESKQFAIEHLKL